MFHEEQKNINYYGIIVYVVILLLQEYNIIIRVMCVYASV